MVLYIMAAGMGSRYGGLKQLDGVGPSGETIMDYSVYDALRAGFDKVVFVIRRSFEHDFVEKIVSKYKGHIAVEYVFQELDKLPEGFSVPEGREKPWGTNHAVLMGQDVIAEPFLVINADDFYGRDAFAVMGEWLKQPHGEGEYSMVGFRVGNTLSESGTVSRGVCEVGSEGYLTGITERTAIERVGAHIQYKDENGEIHTLADNTPVSMNMWGFEADYFAKSKELFVAFLKEKGGELKSEFYIPFAVNSLIEGGQASVKVLDTTSEWFGVTYAEDRPAVVARLAELHARGEYPEGGIF